jgi:leader peptidase (prepilin peptidase)/N-methyltransferase
VQQILDIPLEARLAFLFVLGLLAGNLVNLAIHALPWQPKPYNPWLRIHPRDGGSIWLDRLPLVGWWRLRRKRSELGSGFWLRPLLVEVLCGALLSGLYWWEIGRLGLLLMPLLPSGNLARPTPGTWAILHMVYASHALLVLLMLAASFIDIDDQVIPDSITVPGTLLGLAFSAFYSWNLMPGAIAIQPPGIQFVEFATLVFPTHRFPDDWPALLAGAPQLVSLLLGLACYWFWCLALLPRLWLPGRGLDKAVRMLVAYALRSPSWPVILGLALGGAVFIWTVWLVGIPHWAGLLTSLVGMAVAGGLVWAVRVVATLALGREAMGFGDVTLMAMIGSFLGWQAALMIFFLAPFAGIVAGVVRAVLGRGREIPFGPHLCLAAVVVIFAWVPLWDWLGPVFALGWMVPLILMVVVAMLWVLLVVWRLTLGLFGRLFGGRKPQ